MQQTVGHIATAFSKLSGGQVDLATAATAVAKNPKLLQQGLDSLRLTSVPAPTLAKLKTGDGNGVMADIAKLENQPAGRISQMMADKLGLGDWWFGLGKPQQEQCLPNQQRVFNPQETAAGAPAGR